MLCFFFFFFFGGVGFGILFTRKKVKKNGKKLRWRKKERIERKKERKKEKEGITEWTKGKFFVFSVCLLFFVVFVVVVVCFLFFFFAFIYNCFVCFFYNFCFFAEEENIQKAFYEKKEIESSNWNDKNNKNKEKYIIL